MSENKTPIGSPKKQYYRVKLEVMAPVELIYRVLAETPEKAVENLKYGILIKNPKPALSRQKRIKATVYRFGTTMIEFIKNFK